MNSDDETPEWYKLLESFRARLEKIGSSDPRVCSFCASTSGNTLFYNAVRTAQICDNCVVNLAMKVHDINILESLDDDATRH